MRLKKKLKILNIICLEKIKMTCEYDSFLSLTIENEKLQRLKAICEEKNMTFQDFFNEEILMKKIKEEGCKLVN